MSKNKFLFFLILILAIIVGCLVVWRILLYKPPVPQPAQPTPIPTQKTVIPTPSFSITLTPASQERGDSIADLYQSLKKKFPLIDYLPYQTADYYIDYQASFSLKVKIKTAIAITQVKQEVIDWIKSHGVDPATHKIEYLTPELSPAL